MPNKISDQIKKIRNNRQLSQHRFGKKVGLSGKTISAYETGRVVPPYKVLEKISTTYNYPLISFSDLNKGRLERKIGKIESLIREIKEYVD
jgi:transcriptional regulator with XRE-family HTH domain